MALDRFQKNQRVTADELNALRDGIRQNRILDSDAGIVVGASHAGRTISRQKKYLPQSRLCMVTDGGPDGKGDYTDERYWIRTLACTNDTGDATERLTVTEAHVLDINGDAVTGDNGKVPLWGFWVTATNLAELMMESHTLSIGTPVQVFPMYDSRTESNLHWVFFGATSATSCVRSGKITAVTEVEGPPSVHTYQGVYMDVAGEPEWKTASMGADGETSWTTAELSSLQGHEPNVIYHTLSVDDIVDVVCVYENTATAAAGQDDYYVMNPSGLAVSECPEFVICECDF